jgi:hypothetical protein
VLSVTNTAMPRQSAPELTDAVPQGPDCAPLDIDFVNVTLHCCTPAHAEDIHDLCVVATVPDHEISSVRRPR